MNHPSTDGSRSSIINFRRKSDTSLVYISTKEGTIPDYTDVSIIHGGKSLSHIRILYDYVRTEYFRVTIAQASPSIIFSLRRFRWEKYRRRKTPFSPAGSESARSAGEKSKVEKRPIIKPAD